MKYYIVKSDMRLGPFTLDELRLQGISADTLVWHKGMPDWKEARAVPELAAIAAQEPQEVASSAIPGSDFEPSEDFEDDEAPGSEPVVEPYSPPRYTEPRRYTYAPMPAEPQPRSRKGIYAVVAIVAAMVLLCVMVLTKPTKADYIDALTRTTTDCLLNQPSAASASSSLTGVARYATSKAVGAVLEQALAVEDCFIFNKAKVQIGEHAFTVGFGLFGHVFTVGADQLQAAVREQVQKQWREAESEAIDQATDVIDTVVEIGAQQAEDLGISHEAVNQAVDSIKSQMEQKGGEAVEQLKQKGKEALGKAKEVAKEKAKEAIDDLFN